MADEDRRTRMTLTLREQDGVRLSPGDSDASGAVEVTVSQVRRGRVAVTIEATRSTRIERVPRDRSSEPHEPGDDSPG